MTRGAYSYERDQWIISEEEFKQMYDTARFKQIKIILLILYYYGLRYNEARTLKTNNILINEEKREITIITKNAKRKDNSIRQLTQSIDLPFMKDLVKYVENRELRKYAGIADNNLFDIKYWKGINELRWICKETDNKISFHAFRKSIGTRLAQWNHSAIQIQNWLGHRTPNTAFYYIQNSGVVTKGITDKFKEELGKDGTR